MKNLVYVCIFHQESYIGLLKLLMNSISLKSKIDVNNTDILIITSPEFQPLIEKELSVTLPIKYYTLNLHTLFEAGCARLNIFKYECINSYDKILYLDTDILINSDINILFNIDILHDKIYTLEEGTIGSGAPWWGAEFFDFSIIDRSTTAFTSGILYFKNSFEIKQLFEDIQSHIKTHVDNNLPIGPCLDQPFIIYHTISQNKYDNQILKKYVENSPKNVSFEKIIYHFPGWPGNAELKYDAIASFWEKIQEYSLVNIFQGGSDGFGH